MSVFIPSEIVRSYLWISSEPLKESIFSNALNAATMTFWNKEKTFPKKQYNFMLSGLF
jgi:hypothetical protein